MKPKKILELITKFLKENDFDVVFGTGTFSGGHCIINENRVVVVNKRMQTEEQIRVLSSVILELELDHSRLRKEAREFIERFR
jgi:hypothetical protein